MSAATLPAACWTLLAIARITAGGIRPGGPETVIPPRTVPDLLAALREDDLLIVSADHGNDPTTPSTDHARECVPLLVFGRSVQPRSVGRRKTFSDLGATVAEAFGIGFRGRGSSFLSMVTA